MKNYINRERRKPFILKLFWFVFIVALLSNAAALMVSYFAPYVDPYKYWYVAFLGLAAPLMMLANVVFLLIMTIRLNRWAFVPLAAFLFGIGYIGDYLQVTFVTKYPSNDKYNGTKIKVLTYNVHGFKLHADPTGANMDSLLKFIVEQDADIVALQEIQLFKAADSVRLAEAMRKWKYQLNSLIVDTPFDKWGLGLYSKYPLRNATAIKFDDKINSSLYVDVLIKEDTIRFFSNHLQSTQFNTLDKNKLRKEDVEDAARRVGSKLRNNYKERMFQADTIAGLIAASPYSTIVVGDFNDTPLSYTYHTIKGELKDAFRQCGEGYGYSYIPLYKLFRIDYILHSNDVIDVFDYQSPLLPWSDHKPVIAQMGIRNHKTK